MPNGKDCRCSKTRRWNAVACMSSAECGSDYDQLSGPAPHSSRRRIDSSHAATAKGTRRSAFGYSCRYRKLNRADTLIRDAISMRPKAESAHA